MPKRKARVESKDWAAIILTPGMQLAACTNNLSRSQARQYIKDFQVQRPTQQYESYVARRYQGK